MDHPSAPLMQDKSLLFNEPEPANASPYAPSYPMAPPPYAPQDHGHYTVPPPAQQLKPAAPYPLQAAVPTMAAPSIQQVPVQPAPVQQIIVPPAQATPVVVVGGTPALAPGVCTVCRKGKMKNSASCCTWLWCWLLLPLGILPGICVFCCCCREPKCTSCGYSP